MFSEVARESIIKLISRCEDNLNIQMEVDTMYNDILSLFTQEMHRCLPSFTSGKSRKYF